MKKITLLFLLLCSYVVCNGQTNPDSKAIVNFNSDKLGETNINFNSSFMILNYHIEDAQKKKVCDAIISKDASIKKIDLIDADGKKSMMVMTDFFAADKTELAKKVRIILTEIGISKVECNGKLFNSLNEFSFN